MNTVRKLLIGRHPESVENEAHIKMVRDNDTTPFTPEFLARPGHLHPLSEEGKRQALKAKAWLEQSHPELYVVYCSPAERVREMYEILNLSPGRLIIDDRLSEQTYGVISTQHPEEVKEERTRYEAEYWSNPYAIPRDGMSVYQHYQIVADFWKSISGAHPRENVAILCHGGTIRHLQILTEGLTLAHFADFEPKNKRITNCQFLIYSSVDPVTGSQHATLRFRSSVSPAKPYASEHDWVTLS